ncbi:MAG: hypothetical protein V1809_15730 [Planctomycetota bacterium]
MEQMMSVLPEYQRRGLDYYPMPFPPNGYGEIQKNLKMLVKLYEDASERQRIGCDFFVVVLDSRKTEKVQRQIKDVLRGAHEFPAVYAVAIQETEAWVLGDIGNVNKHVFKVDPEPPLPKAPEKDPDPKKTLEDLFVRASPVLEYDAWNTECARAIAPHLRKDVVAGRCPKGFGKFAVGFEQTIRRLRKV